MRALRTLLAIHSHRLAAMGTAALMCAAAMGSAQALETDYGCHNLDHNRTIPTLEGENGNFFRIQPDLRMYFPMNDVLIADLARLSDALALRGTTLVYLPVPPKGMTMPGFLPEEARLYGFDPLLAQRIYRDTVAKLRAAGIVTVDLLEPLTNSDPDVELFFKADFHWTTAGAQRAAEAVAETIKQDAGFAELATSTFETTPTGSQRFVSAMRQLIQKSCIENLPEPHTETYKTVEVVDPDAAVDIFGNAGADTISLVGTSFSEVAQFNFAGFISQYSGLNVRNLAISGGNQFASITSYLTSKNFDEDQPKYLIWENPIYNNLAQFGDGPLDELVTAVTGGCDVIAPSALQVVADNELSVNLLDGSLANSGMLLAEAGSLESRQVSLTFTDSAGRVRTQSVLRPARFRTSGRFFIPIGSYSADGFSTLSIRFDRPGAKSAVISACSPNSKGPSL
jgi:alginate biosynthesis protein AlgX